MADLYADPSMINANAAKIGDMAIDYKRLVDEINKAKEELRNGWSSPASQTYIVSLDNYNNVLNDLYHTITNYSEFLKKAAGNVSRTDSDIASDAGRLGN